MAVERHQSRCRDCNYVWYQRDKEEVCPKCKGGNVAYHRGLGRSLAILLVLGLVISGAVYGFIYWRGTMDAGDGEPAGVGGTVAAKEEGGSPESEPDEGEAALDSDLDLQPGTLGDVDGKEQAKGLTSSRTWTARDGRTLEAALLRLKMVEGRYVGVFERPSGETFDYKIGNLSKADVDLVKGIVAEEE